jgi:hypothetical protein
MRKKLTVQPSGLQFEAETSELWDTSRTETCDGITT